MDAVLYLNGHKPFNVQHAKDEYLETHMNDTELTRLQ
jgi:hypothetical protein